MRFSVACFGMIEGMCIDREKDCPAEKKVSETPNAIHQARRMTDDERQNYGYMLPRESKPEYFGF